jgi:hypothetical protein
LVIVEIPLRAVRKLFDCNVAPAKNKSAQRPPLAGIVPGDSPAYQKKGALCDRPQTPQPTTRSASA